MAEPAYFPDIPFVPGRFRFRKSLCSSIPALIVDDDAEIRLLGEPAHDAECLRSVLTGQRVF